MCRMCCAMMVRGAVCACALMAVRCMFCCEVCGLRNALCAVSCYVVQSFTTRVNEQRANSEWQQRDLTNLPRETETQVALCLTCGLLGF